MRQILLALPIMFSLIAFAQTRQEVENILEAKKQDAGSEN